MFTSSSGRANRWVQTKISIHIPEKLATRIRSTHVEEERGWISRAALAGIERALDEREASLRRR